MFPPRPVLMFSCVDNVHHRMRKVALMQTVHDIVTVMPTAGERIAAAHWFVREGPKHLGPAELSG